MKITNEIDETMISVKHRKVYWVHLFLPDLQLSDLLMKAVLMQILHEDLGMPISIACLENELQPKISMKVTMLFLCYTLLDVFYSCSYD